jgi:hypothetical protein
MMANVIIMRKMKGLALLYVHRTSHYSTCLTFPLGGELSEMKEKSSVSQYVTILANNTNMS